MKASIKILGVVGVMLLGCQSTACSDDEHSATSGGGGEGGDGGSAGAPSCDGTVTDDPQLAQVLEVLKTNVDERGIPGGAVAIVKDGKLVDVAVYGSKRAGECDPITPDTLFRVGYATETITALAVLDAEEDGLLDRNRPITDVIPNLSVTNDDFGSADDITLHHLLTNTSMYKAPSDDNADHYIACSSLADAYAEVEDRFLYAVPGSMQTADMDSNFEIAGLALEIADGVPYPDAVAARVLDPLGMGGAFDTATVLGSDHAWGDQGGVEGIEGDCRNRDPSFGYHGSTRDMARLAEYLTGGEGAVLAPDVLDDMLSNQGPHFWSDSYTAYGIGIGFHFQDIEDDVLQQGGWAEGFSQHVVIFRERRLALITLLNTARANDVAYTINNAVAKIYEDALAILPDDYSLDTTSIPSLAGTYTDALGFDGVMERTLEVAVDPGDPEVLLGMLSSNGGAPEPLVLVSAFGVPDNFTFEVGAYVQYLRFWRDANGDSYAIQLEGANGPPFYRVLP